MTEQTIEYQTVTEQSAERQTAAPDLAEYRPTAAALELLRDKYAAPFEVTTAAGLTAAKAARAEIRGYRATLEKTRAELKAPVLARGQFIDAEAKRINAALLAIEEPIDAAIKAEERRKAEEKAARERAEVERVAALLAALRAALDDARAVEPDPDTFAERWPDAMRAIGEVRLALETLLAEREEREARQAA